MGILALENKQRGVIDAAGAVRVDGRRWLAAAATLNAVHCIATLAVMSASTEWENAQVVLWQQRAEFGIALTYCAAAIATGQLHSLKTVIVAAAGLFFWQLSLPGCVLWSIAPVTSLMATAGIVSSLAIWRLVEYYDMLRNSGLEQPPRFTLGAWLWYGGFAVVPFLLVYF